MKQTVGIIGGNGKMGRCFAAFFEEYGFDVIVSDRGTKLTNKKLVQNSDIIFVAVSISHIQSVLNEVVPLLKKSQILMEINSIKDPLISILKSAPCEVISLHPMCNETQLTAGAKMLFMPVKGNSAAKLFKNIFKEAKFNLQEIAIERHDKLMALIQGLPHFAEISFAHTMKDLGFKTKELMKFASPATDLKLKMVGRILAQSPELYGSMQIQNPRNKKIIKAHLDSINELYEIIEQGDFKAFEKYFSSAAEFLGKYKDEALAETDHVISTLRQEDLFGEAKISQVIKPKKIIANKSISLLGPAMTYTDTAADLFLQKSETKKSTFTKQVTNKVFKSTIEDVILEVANGKSKFGMVPIENRLHGTVRETLDGLFTHDVQIIDMIYLPINHCLAVLPSVNPKDIKIVMSHNQAISQCKSYLQKHFRGADLVSVSSSAKAFENVKSKNFRHIAVIGPAPSAKHYGFKILKENIADDVDNVTKFAVITKGQKTSKISISTYKNPFLKNPKNSSIAFYFLSDKAGSLFTVFEAFAKHKVNMTRVESRPYKKDFGNYLFFIDFEGNLSDTKVKDTIKTVSTITAGLKFLGTY